MNHTNRSETNNLINAALVSAPSKLNTSDEVPESRLKKMFGFLFAGTPEPAMLDNSGSVMKFSKLLKTAESFLEGKEHDKKVSKKNLKTLINDLQKKEKQIEEKLAKAEDPDQIKKLKNRIKILHAQRKKGLKQLQAM